MKKLLIIATLIPVLATVSYAQTSHLDGETQLVNPSGRTLLIERENDDSWLTFHDPNDSWYSLGIDKSNSGSFSLNYGGELNSTQFSMLSNGNVGIGNGNPVSKLDVNGAVRISNRISILSWYNPVVGHTHNSFVMNGDRINGNWRIFGDGARSSIGVIDTDIFANIRFISHHDSNFIDGKSLSDEELINNNTKMIITNDGQVGIGTTAPLAQLHVSDEAIPQYSGNRAFDANLIVQSTSTSRNISEGAAIGFVLPANTDGSNHWQQGRILVTPDNQNTGDASGRMYLQTRYLKNQNEWAYRDNLVLKSNGNVGIGTENPDAELAVNGTIHTKEVKVDLIGWSDFVFEESYDLPSLEQVEAQIKEKGHLKDIPSAAEVAENGIYLGEMDAKLLQKIEELTLYMIDLNKQVQTQKTEIEQLKAKNALLESK